MIEEIVIRDLGVIGGTTLPLGAGFTAVTGETGAGKTMVVTALGLLLGARADSGVVRHGAAQAVVEGRFLVPERGAVADRVDESGGSLDPLDDGSAELLVARTVSAEGRGRASVGGRSAPVGVLGDLAEHLVAVHGQNDQVRLRSQAAQREALDRFAGAEVQTLLAAYRLAHRRWQGDRETLETLVTERDARRAEAERLRAALDEIEAVDPQQGEDEQLAVTANRLGGMEELRLAAQTAHEALSSESIGEAADVLALLDAALRAVERVRGLDETLAPIADQLSALQVLAAEAAGALASYVSGLDADTAHELEQVEERRAALVALARRHGPTLDDVLALAASGSDRLLELDGDEDRIVDLEAAVSRGHDEALGLGRRLSALRTEAGSRLAEAVTAELGALAMADSALVVEIEQRDEFASHGLDQVRILLRSYPGAEPRPLGRGASGGELSRIMLAIEVVLASSDPVPTFVFDEVDAGVGGAAALEIGRRLQRLAERSQVIVVTHLAQVAAFATNHLTVRKGSDGEVTASSVRRLDGDDRVAEMARLLSGLPDSASGTAHARELLALAAAPGV